MPEREQEWFFVNILDVVFVTVFALVIVKFHFEVRADGKPFVA